MPPSAAPPRFQPRRLVRRFVILLVLSSLVCLAWSWRSGRLATPFWIERMIGPFATVAGAGLQVRLYEPGGLRVRDNRVTLEFRDARTAAPVDVGSVYLKLGQRTAGMVVDNTSIASRVPGAAGRYQAIVRPDAAGAWQAEVRYEGARGAGTLPFPVSVRMP